MAQLYRYVSARYMIRVGILLGFVCLPCIYAAAQQAGQGETVADVRVFSYAFAPLAFGFYLFNFEETYTIPLFFVLLALASHILSIRLTHRQVDIGNQQLKIIKLLYSEKVKSSLGSLHE